MFCSRFDTNDQNERFLETWVRKNHRYINNQLSLSSSDMPNGHCSGRTNPGAVRALNVSVIPFY